MKFYVEFRAVPQHFFYFVMMKYLPWNNFLAYDDFFCKFAFFANFAK